MKFVWVKGHADIPENERCDQLAVQASKMPNLQIDYYYEAEQDNNLKLFIFIIIFNWFISIPCSDGD